MDRHPRRGCVAVEKLMDRTCALSGMMGERWPRSRRSGIGCRSACSAAKSNSHDSVPSLMSDRPVADDFGHLSIIAAATTSVPGLGGARQDGTGASVDRRPRPCVRGRVPVRRGRNRCQVEASHIQLAPTATFAADFDGKVPCLLPPPFPDGETVFTARPRGPREVSCEGKQPHPSGNGSHGCTIKRILLLPSTRESVSTGKLDRGRVEGAGCWTTSPRMREGFQRPAATSCHPKSPRRPPH